MRIQQIEILINLFKKESIKKAFVHYQYHLPLKVGSLILSQRNTEIEDMTTKQINEEEEINKKWKKNPEWSLTKLLINEKITFSFPNYYSLEEASWNYHRVHTLYEDIMFKETDDGFKLISTLNKTQLTELKNTGDYLEKMAACRVLNNFT